MNLLKKYQARFDKKINQDIEQVRIGGIWAVFKLFNRYYLKSFFGPFFTFVFPVVILGIIGSIMNPSLVFPGIAAMAGMSAGITGMPFSILELKKSVLLKRIGSSPVKPSAFTIVIISYYTFMIFVSILWIMLWALIFFQDTSMFNPLGTVVGFFGFLYGNVLNIIMSLAIGFAVATISKSEISAQAIGMLIYFPSSFLSGQFFAIDQIVKVEVLGWVSRFIPARYTTMIVVESWNGGLDPAIGALAGISSEGNPFLIHDYYQANMAIATDYNALIKALPNGPQAVNTALVDSFTNSIKSHSWVSLLYDKADHIVAYIYPYVLIVLSGIYSIKKFSWSAGR